MPHVLPVIPPVVLEYQHAPAARAQVSRWWRMLALLAAAPAVVSAFVDYTFSVSPLDVAAEFFSRILRTSEREALLLMLVAAPFFLGPLVALRCLRLLISESETRVERLLYLSVAAGSALLTLTFFGFGVYRFIADADRLAELMKLVPGPAVIVLGLLLLWWMRRRRVRAGVIATASLYVAYLANAIICIIEFWHDSDPGWKWALAASAIFTLHLSGLILQSLTSRRAG